MDVEFKHIDKRFGTLQALTDINLKAESGSIHGLIGENGAGKSTLMKILTGYQSRNEGEILIDGNKVELHSPEEAAALGIGMLYQEPMDFPSLTVLDNFSLGCPSQAKSHLRKSLFELSHRFGFHLIPERIVEQLTVGERQQIELLRLIHCKTRILILDEPTTGISPAQKEALFPVLKQLTKEGMTILLVSHKLEEVAALCNEVTVLRHGRITHYTKAPFHFPESLHAMFGSIPERDDKEAPRKTGDVVLSFSAIEAEGERQGLHNCTVSVRAGEIIGLAGLDGAGQSTFLRLAAGLTVPTQGAVSLFGSPLPRSRRASHIAQQQQTAFLPADRLEEALFHEISLSDHFSLKEQKPSFLQSGKKSRRQAEKDIAAFSIKGKAGDMAKDLSGGNQQRLLLALLDPDSRLVLLENPTRGLDIRSGQWVWQYLRCDLPTDSAILFSSPELDEILHYSDRILVFHDGEIVLDSGVKDTDHDKVAAAMTGIQ